MSSVLPSEPIQTALPTPVPVIIAKTGRFDWVPVIFSILLVLSWSGAFAAVRVALEGYTPVQVAFLRYLIASVLFAGYAVITKMPFPARHDWPGIAGLGVLGFAIYSLLLNVGEQTVSSGVTSLIIASEAATIALFARIFVKEKLSVIGWVGIGLCFAGSAVLTVGSDSHFQVSAGALILIGAMVATSVYTVALRKYTGRYNGIHLTAWMIWASVPILFLAAPDALTAVTAAPLQATAAIVFLGVFPSVIGYTLWTLLVTRISIARAGSVTTLVPVGSVLLGMLLLSEVPSPFALIGGAVILGGVVLVNRH